jgi:predicted  nucleic acid-binding Zn-ribbon protein
MQVTTMKEMEATRAETATATARKAELEDAILAAMTEIEERTARLPQDDRRWVETQAEFKQFEIDAKERYERLVEDQKLTNEKLVECDKHIPADIKPQYDRLIRTYGPDGLAGVKANFCQQCRLKLTDQQLFNLQRGKFMCCPQCGRALYPMD